MSEIKFPRDNNNNNNNNNNDDDFDVYGSSDKSATQSEQRL